MVHLNIHKVRTAHFADLHPLAIEIRLAPSISAVECVRSKSDDVIETVEGAFPSAVVIPVVD